MATKNKSVNLSNLSPIELLAFRVKTYGNRDAARAVSRELDNRRKTTRYVAKAA